MQSWRPLICSVKRWNCIVVSVSRLAIVVRSPFVMVRRRTASMLSFAARVDRIVLGDIAGGSGVAGRGIGRGAKDSAGDMFDRLIDPFDDMWTGWGYGRDRCDRYMVHRSSSGGRSVVSVWICGAKYKSLDDVELGGLGIKGGDSMPT